MSEQTTGTAQTTGTTTSTGGAPPASSSSTSSTSSSSAPVQDDAPEETEETEETEDGEVADEDEALEGLIGLAQRRKEKEPDGKRQEAPPRPMLGPGNYVMVGTRNVRVHGADVLVAGGGLRVDINLVRYPVTRMAAPVAAADWQRIAYTNVARIDGHPLSLGPTWQFAWGVPIGDIDKYFTDAWALYSAFSDLEMGGVDTQYYGILDDPIEGYRAHVSLSRSDVHLALKNMMARGAAAPANGWLADVKFHVTVEVGPRNDKGNPRVFEENGQWQGKTGKIGTTTPKSAYRKGLAWLRSHR